MDPEIGGNRGSDGELVELISVQGEMEANVLKGVLESEGIRPIVKSDIVHSVHPITVDGLGEVRIYVRRTDLARAVRVLEEYRRDDLPPGGGPEEEG